MTRRSARTKAAGAVPAVPGGLDDRARTAPGLERCGGLSGRAPRVGDARAPVHSGRRAGPERADCVAHGCADSQSGSSSRRSRRRHQPLMRGRPQTRHPARRRSPRSSPTPPPKQNLRQHRRRRRHPRLRPSQAKVSKRRRSRRFRPAIRRPIDRDTCTGRQSPDIGLHRHVRSGHQSQRALEHPRLWGCRRRGYDRPASPGGHPSARGLVGGRLVASLGRCRPRRARPGPRRRGGARATRRSPTSGRCRGSAGTTSTATSTRRDRRSSPSSTPASTPRIPTSPAQLVAGHLDSSTASPGPPTRTATARRSPASSPPPRTTAPASPASASTASRSCRSPSSVPTGSARTATSSRASSGRSTTAPTSSTCRFSDPGLLAAAPGGDRLRLGARRRRRRRDRQRRLDARDLPRRRPRRGRRLRHGPSDDARPASNYGADTSSPRPGGDPDARRRRRHRSDHRHVRRGGGRSPAPPALLRAIDPAPSNGVIVGRLARSAAAAGTRPRPATAGWTWRGRWPTRTPARSSPAGVAGGAAARSSGRTSPRRRTSRSPSSVASLRALLRSRT